MWAGVISGILVYDNGYFVEDASEIEFCLRFWSALHSKRSLYDHNRVDLMNAPLQFHQVILWSDHTSIICAALFMLKTNEIRSLFESTHNARLPAESLC